MIPILYTPHEPQYHEPIITVFFHIHSVFISPSTQLFVSLYHTLFEASCYFGDLLIKLNISSIYPYRRSLFSYFRNFPYSRNHYCSVLWVMRDVASSFHRDLLAGCGGHHNPRSARFGRRQFRIFKRYYQTMLRRHLVGVSLWPNFHEYHNRDLESLPFKLSDHRNVEKLKVAVKAQRTILGCQREIIVSNLTLRNLLLIVSFPLFTHHKYTFQVWCLLHKNSPSSLVSSICFEYPPVLLSPKISFLYQAKEDKSHR